MTSSSPTGVVVVELMPTYTGCPAMDVMRDDVVAALRRAGYDDIDVRVQLTPAWTSDRISAAGRRKLAAAGIAPPGPAPGRVPGTAHPDHRAPRGTPADVPALWLDGHGGDVALRSRRRASRCTAAASCAEPFEHFKAL